MCMRDREKMCIVYKRQRQGVRERERERPRYRNVPSLTSEVSRSTFQIASIYKLTSQSLAPLKFGEMAPAAGIRPGDAARLVCLDSLQIVGDICSKLAREHRSALRKMRRWSLPRSSKVGIQISG